MDDEQIEYQQYQEFLDAVRNTRNEPGLSIEKIAKAFDEIFDGAELKALLKELDLIIS